MTDLAVAPMSGKAAFTLGRPTLTWLLLRIGLLNIVTLGFYRFWGKTRLRASFWSALSIGGERFEYTGRPIELLLGFLMTLAILAPLYGAASVAQVAAAVSGPTAVALVQIGTVLAVMLLWPIAVYRARRYRLSRTLWRGIRFGQDGSAVRYSAMTLGYWVLTIATLWLAYPWMRVALQRYKMRHTRYGQTKFDFDVRGSALFFDWFMAWAALVATLVALGATVSVIGGAYDAPTGAAPEATLRAYFEAMRDSFAPLALAAAALFGALVASGLLLVRYYLAEIRLFFGGTTLAGVSFAAHPSVGVVVSIGLIAAMTFVCIALGTIVLIAGPAILAGIATARGALDASDARAYAALIGGIVAVAMVPLFFFFLMPMLRYVFVYVPFLRHLTSVVAISDLGALDAVVQDEGERPKTGEGLADALDVGGI
jgi:uncharacterized membrane protein YjgN (DUF898 family)